MASRYLLEPCERGGSLPGDRPQKPASNTIRLTGRFEAGLQSVDFSGHIHEKDDRWKGPIFEFQTEATSFWQVFSGETFDLRIGFLRNKQGFEKYQMATDSELFIKSANKSRFYSEIFYRTVR